MRVLIVCLSCLVAFSSHTLATVIHVPAQQSSIQRGIDAAFSGDTVLVAPGLYGENVNLKGKAICLSSSGGREVTIIQTASTGWVITCNSNEAATTIIEGFTVDGSSFAPGILCYSASPTIQYCEIRNCSSSMDGGGIYCYDSDARIHHNLIHDNKASATGSGICVTESKTTGVEISYNEIFNSTGTGEAIGCLYVTGVKIHHNLIRDNTVDFWSAGAIYFNGGTGIEIINNTLVRNTHGVTTYGSPQPLILNNIITNNTQVALPTGFTQVDYNDIWSNGSPDYVSSNGISEDPQFSDPVNNDFSLQPTSPCVDAGHPDPQYVDPDGSRNDLGAFPMTLLQEVPYPANFKILPRNLDGTVSSLTPSFSWTYVDTSGLTQTSYWVQVGTDDDWVDAETWDSGPIASADTSVLFGGWPLADATIYYVRVRLFNGSIWGGWRQLRMITRASRTIRVPLHQPTIQKGIDASSDGDTVMVSAGTYQEHINTRGKRIVLTTASGPLVTTLRPLNAGSAVITCNTGEGTTTVIEQFSIDGANINRGIYCDHTSPIIQQCEIRNCVGESDGGGILCASSSAIVRQNKIYANLAGATGSGICVYAASAVGVEIVGNEFYGSLGPGQAIGLLYATKTYIHHNVFHDNKINHWSAGGIYINASNDVRIINNTFVNNTHGITTYSNPQPLIRNNIIVGCTQAALPSGLSLADYNNLWNNQSGNLPGPHGISVDPMFLAPDEFNFALLPESPCRDAGDPDPQYNDPDGSRNDLGAFWGTVRDPYVTNLHIEGEDRSHVRTSFPLFAWSYSTSGSHTLDSIEFEVGRDYDWTVAELWSTGPMMYSATTLSYQGAPLQRGTLCTYRLRVFDGVDWSEWAQSNFKMNSLPAVPTLRQPIDLVMTAQVPQFKVKTFGDADNDLVKVDFTICSDSELTHPLIGLARATISTWDSTCAWQPSNAFAENGAYYWSARTWDGFESSAWAPPSRLWYNNMPEPPGPFGLSYPPMLATDALPTLTPTMIWDRCIDPDPQDTLFYRLEIAADSAFNFLFSQDSILDTFYFLGNPLQVNRRYWWRVMVEDRTGNTSFSGEGSFWTWMQGDVDLSRRIDLSDLSLMIAFLVAEQVQEMPEAVGDVTGDCRIDLSDLSMLITFMTGTRVDFAEPCLGTVAPLHFRSLDGSLMSSEGAPSPPAKPRPKKPEISQPTRVTSAANKGESL